MRFKSILCIVDLKQSDRDIKDAIDLCTEMNAHLSVLVIALATPPPIGGTLLVADKWMAQREADIGKLESRVERVNALVAKSGLSSDVDSEYSEFASAEQIIGRRARYVDLTLVGPELVEKAALKVQAVNGGLFESSTPLLITPAGSKPTLRPKKVLLAWDSRIEAARAAHEAIDLLVEAADVNVTLVDPEATFGANGPEPGADIATYLARHGAKATVTRLSSAKHSVADALRQHAVDISADMIVMGAYGHSRLRERIFGGVTKSMIEEPPLPVFMAH